MATSACGPDAEVAEKVVEQGLDPAATASVEPVCAMPDTFLGNVPGDVAPFEFYATQWVTGPEGEGVQLGVGHLHYSDRNSSAAEPPGRDGWFQHVSLPLSREAGETPFAWITRGWVVDETSSPRALSLESLVETGYEDPSFVVLEAREDGWLLIRYGTDESEALSAWTPSCALAEGDVVLEYEEWSTRLLSDQISPLFFRAETPGALSAGASESADVLPPIAQDYALEPLEIDGDWMRVRVKEPSDYCEFDLEVASREGWIRWHEPDVGPTVWYFTRGC